MKRYYTKMTETTKEKTKAYYKEGIRLLLQTGETMENFEQVLEEYKSALIIRNKRIDDLYNEIKIIKRLKVLVYKKVCFKKTSYGIFILS